LPSAVSRKERHTAGRRKEKKKGKEHFNSIKKEKGERSCGRTLGKGDERAASPRREKKGSPPKKPPPKKKKNPPQPPRRRRFALEEESLLPTEKKKEKRPCLGRGKKKKEIAGDTPSVGARRAMIFSKKGRGCLISARRKERGEIPRCSGLHGKGKKGGWNLMSMCPKGKKKKRGREGESPSFYKPGNARERDRSLGGKG